jgi:hypothetical protein
MDVSVSAADTRTVAPRGQLLVVCCAAGAADQLEPAFELLRGRGFEIAVIEDTQTHTPAVIEQVKRHGARAIYVLVKGAELDAASSGRFAQVLRSTKVLPKHIVEVVLDWRDPLALVHQLQELEPRPAPHPATRRPSEPRLRKRSTSHVAGSREPTGPRPIVTTSPSRRGTSPTHAPIGAKTAVSRSSDRAARTVAPQPPKSSAPSPDPAQSEPPAGAVESTPAMPLPQMTVPLMPASPADVDPAASLQTSGNARSAGTGGVRAPGIRCRRVLTDSFRLIAEATTRRLRHVTRPRARTWVLVVSGMGALIFAGILVMISEKDPPAAGEGEIVAAPEPAEDVSADPEADAAVVAAASRREALEQAQGLGQLGIHDGIVYAPLQAPKRDFHAAAQMCEEMNRGSVGGWRMPKLGEIHTLAAAHVIERGVYWSGTEADGFPGFGLIWSEKNTRAAPIAKHWKGARAMCILDDAPADLE